MGFCGFMVKGFVGFLLWGFGLRISECLGLRL